MIARPRTSTMAFLLLGVATAVALVTLVAPYANPNPDGLEKVSADQGIDSGVADHALAAGPLAGYGVSGVASDVVATGMAGVAGILATFAVGAGVTWSVRRRRGRPTPLATSAGSAV